MRMVSRNQVGSARRKNKKEKICGEGGVEVEQEGDFTLTRLEH